MLNRLRRFGWLLLAAGIGYALASGVVADFLTDIVHMGGIYLNRYRLKSGSGGTAWILIAGFLLGQGGVLAARRLVMSALPKTIRWTEDDASWDPSLLLATRFGFQRYLKACEKWTVDTNSESTQSIALFKISGLGRVNDLHSTRIATRLLQDIAAQLRIAALPPDASRISVLLAQYLPRPFKQSETGAPATRCAARWSGSTFALGFRGLEVNQAIVSVRALAAGIRSELADLEPDSQLELRVAFVMGPVRASARSILAAAATAIKGGDANGLTVAVDPRDGRGPLLAAMPNLQSLEIPMERAQTDIQNKAPHDGGGVRAWIFAWGPVIACLAGVPIVVGLGSGGADFERTYPWPADVTTVPVIDASGTAQVKLVRQGLSDESSANWVVSQGQMTQAEPGDHRVRAVEVKLAVTNHSMSARYVSLYDFAALDASGRELSFPPKRVLWYADPLDSRWVQPGETWTGWMGLSRKDAAIQAIVFQPDGKTRLVLRALQPASAITSDQHDEGRPIENP